MGQLSNMDLDAKKCAEGVKVFYSKDIWVQLRPLGPENVQLKKITEELFRPYRVVYENGMMPEDDANEIMAEAFSKAVIVGWGGLEDSAGVEQPFTWEAAKVALIKYPRFFQFCQKQALDAGNFRKVALEAVLPN